MDHMEHASGDSCCNLAKVAEGASVVCHESDLRRAGS